MNKTTGERTLALAEKRWPNKKIPHGGMARIADEVSVTRERVRQILQAAGFSSVAHQALLCIDCGKEVAGVNLRCRECRKKFTALPNCRCTGCGKPIKRNHPKELNFCSKECQGKWLGKNYGVGSIKRPRKARRKPLVTTRCAYCGAEIHIRGSALKRFNFCSKHHSMQWRLEHDCAPMQIRGKHIIDVIDGEQQV